MKRKKKSWQGSKKLAKKGHRSAPSQSPEVGTFELDMTGVPREKLELDREHIASCQSRSEVK